MIRNWTIKGNMFLDEVYFDKIINKISLEGDCMNSAEKIVLSKELQIKIIEFFFRTSVPKMVKNKN